LEDDEFWQHLGGKKPYAGTEAWAKHSANEPRLFHISQSSGKLHVEEKQFVVQTQLTDEDVFWVDCFTDMYVWYGANTRGSLRLGALQYAKEYAAFAGSIRDAPVEVKEVLSGAEPAEFTWQFHAWRGRPPRKDPRAERLKLIQQEALEDRQLEQQDDNLGREERWELREGEFEDRVFCETVHEFEADSYLELEAVPPPNGGESTGEFRIKLVLQPGEHKWQWEVDAGDWAADPRRPVVDQEGVGQVNKLVIKGKTGGPRTEYKMHWKPPPAAEGAEAPQVPVSVRIRGIPQSSTKASWRAEHPKV